jgi:hypothetical protein
LAAPVPGQAPEMALQMARVQVLGQGLHREQVQVRASHRAQVQGQVPVTHQTAVPAARRLKMALPALLRCHRHCRRRS